MYLKINLTPTTAPESHIKSNKYTHNITYNKTFPTHPPITLTTQRYTTNFCYLATKINKHTHNITNTATNIVTTHPTLLFRTQNKEGSRGWFSCWYSKWLWSTLSGWLRRKFERWRRRRNRSWWHHWWEEQVNTSINGRNTVTATITHPHDITSLHTVAGAHVLNSALNEKSTPDYMKSVDAASAHENITDTNASLVPSGWSVTAHSHTYTMHTNLLNHLAAVHYDIALETASTTPVIDITDVVISSRNDCTTHPHTTVPPVDAPSDHTCPHTLPNTPPIMAGNSITNRAPSTPLPYISATTVPLIAVATATLIAQKQTMSPRTTFGEMCKKLHRIKKERAARPTWMEITIRFNMKSSLQVRSCMSVAELKAVINVMTGIPISLLLLRAGNRRMEIDGRDIWEYGVRAGTVINVSLPIVGCGSGISNPSRPAHSVIAPASLHTQPVRVRVRVRLVRLG